MHQTAIYSPNNDQKPDMKISAEESFSPPYLRIKRLVNKSFQDQAETESRRNITQSMYLKIQSFLFL